MDENFPPPSGWAFKLPWRRRTSAADVARAMAKTRKRSLKVSRALNKQIVALQAWGAGLSGQNRNMIFHFVALIEQLGEIGVVGPLEAMEIVGAKETKMEELLAQEKKLAKARAHVAAKYGSHSTLAVALADEIQENQLKMALVRQQLTDALGVGLRGALGDFLGSVMENLLRVEQAARLLEAEGAHLGEFFRKLDVEESEKVESSIRDKDEIDISEKDEFPQTPKKIPFVALKDAVNQPWARMPSMFAKALSIVGKRRKETRPENKAPIRQLHESEISPREIKAQLRQQALERKKNLHPMASRLEAEQINKTELHSEWASVDNDTDQKPPRGGTAHRVWTGW